KVIGDTVSGQGKDSSSESDWRHPRRHRGSSSRSAALLPGVIAPRTPGARGCPSRTAGWPTPLSCFPAAMLSRRAKGRAKRRSWLGCLLGRTPGDELEVRPYDRHPAIPTARVDDAFVIKLGAGHDDDAVERSGLVNARGDGRRSGRYCDGVGAKNPIKIRQASRRHGWGSETSAWRRGLNFERRVAGWRQGRERRSARRRRDNNHIALAIPRPGYWWPGCQAPMQSPLTVGQKTQTGHGHC